MPNYFAHESAVIDEGSTIGANTKIWHFSHIMPNATIGDSCVLGQNVFVANGVTVGNGVKIQNNVSLFTGVVCEDDVFLGPSCVFTNVINPRSHIERKEEFKTTLVKKGASIGANATIICGNSIGKYAMVGAGALINISIPDFAVAVGNPVRCIGWVSEAGNRLNFNEEGVAQCGADGSRYTLVDNKVKLIA